jgi:hypothetical protein
MLLNTLFSEVYVITVKTNSRLIEFTEEMAKVGCSFKVFTALEPPDASAGFNRARALEYARLTALSLLEKAKADKLESIMIFEDDAALEDDFLTYAEYAAEFIRTETWDMFYWGINHVRPPILIRPHINKVTGGYTGHAFAIHSRFFDFMIDLFSPSNNTPPDVLMAMSHSAHNVYAVHPRLIYQRPSFSSLEQHEVVYSGLRDPRV